MADGSQLEPMGFHCSDLTSPDASTMVDMSLKDAVCNKLSNKPQVLLVPKLVRTKSGIRRSTGGVDQSLISHVTSTIAETPRGHWQASP